MPRLEPTTSASCRWDCPGASLVLFLAPSLCPVFARGSVVDEEAVPQGSLSATPALQAERAEPPSPMSCGVLCYDGEEVSLEPGESAWVPYARRLPTLGLSPSSPC